MSIKGVIDGQPVNAATTTTAFLAKNGDDSTTHKVGFADTDTVSGTAIDNAQRELNAILSALGMSPNQIATFKLTWASDAVGAANDTVKARIEALVTLIQTKADASALATKADASALTAHTGATTSVHGIADTAALVTKTGTQTLSGKTFSDAATFAQIATPANPSTGFNKIYAKADGKFYTLDSSGTETQVGSGAGGGTGGSATIYSYGPVSSTASQSTIGPLGFSVPVGSRGNFYLSIDGKEMSEGATNDYTWIDSANIQLNTTLTAGLNIKASYIASIPAGNVTTTATPANKNYITYGNFENNATTGWSLGTIGTLTNALPTGTPTFGSGAAGTLSISTVSSGKLAGTFSLQLAASAATVAGNMLASDAYAIDIADQAKVLSFKFNYKLASGTADFSGTKTNSFAVAVWDATNSAFIPVTGAFNLVQSSGVGVAQGTFQTNATTSSIRFIVYCANATSGAVTILLDDFYVGPQSLAFGPPVTDTAPGTAFTFSPGFGTIAANNLFYERRGDRLRVHGNFTDGTETTALAYIQLPAGLTVDTSKISTTASGTYLGFITRLTSGTATINQQQSVVFFDGSTTNQLFFTTSMTSGAFTKQAVSTSFSGVNGTQFTLDFEVPISGWSSNTVMSADSDTRFVGAQYSVLSSTTVTGGTALKFATLGYDSHASYSTSTGAFVAPSTGKYSFSLVGLYALSGGADVRYAINGTVSSYYIGGVGNAGRCTINGTVNLNAGDSLTIVPASSFTAGDTAGAFSIQKQSGPATVAASEKVYLQYTGNAGTALTANVTNIDFSTKVVDSHSAWNGTAFSAPRPGWYNFTGGIRSASGGISPAFYAYVNGVQKYFVGGTVSAALWMINGGGYLNTGDTVTIRSDTSFTLQTNATIHYINISSQG